jgi:four helix bundle protein
MTLERRGSHKDLILWRKAMDLATDVHRLTRLLPSNEMFGLISQIRRSAVSIPSNIAEGTARRTTREFLAFLHIARGSSAELDTQLQLARNVGYLADADLVPVLAGLDEVGRLLNAVINGLRRRQQPASSLSPIP